LLGDLREALARQIYLGEARSQEVRVRHELGKAIHNGTATATSIPDARADARETFFALSGSGVSWSSRVLSASGEAATFVSRSKITANVSVYTITIWAEPSYDCTTFFNVTFINAAFFNASRAFEPLCEHISASNVSRTILKWT
jgi:hypothetical protein